ncbi:molybdenum cofactor guanylyltransferase [Brevibacillus sp. SYP-B805]|uniref:molybdenum cofactor guanylyltransferase n=1 Tax=Brevibacillus sp. SYP-B805 TaxID=1578199 RepID=UPI001F49EA79|nr:molybdenum cofactor guanylyltransferase [Brevibacillus sp. SYP-B805]
MDVCGVILAGGRSSRMGERKELLPWRGETLIGWLAKNIRAAGMPCLIVSNEPVLLPGEVTELPEVEVVNDLIPSHGPISGIVTAFRVRREEALLVLSCDLPFAEREQLLRLRGYGMQTGGWDALIAQSDGRLQPLFALYHRRTQAVWEEAFLRGEHRLMAALDRMRVEPTPEGLLDRWATYNANTPQEFAAALEEAKKRGYG